MNKQKKGEDKRGIEWTDYTSNPVRGCQHACKWTMPDGTLAICYAEELAERGVSKAAYPNGFSEHQWHPDVMKKWHSQREPQKIFLDSMSDLFGMWVPRSQIVEVLDNVRQTHWHTYQALTKNAPRLLEFADLLPPNLWVGVSAPPTHMLGHHLNQVQQSRMVMRALSTLRKIDVPVKWMSVEPLSFDIAPLMVGSGLQWAVIGAASNGRNTFQPEPAWVENLLRVFDKEGVKVFFKGNLKGNAAAVPWREEFPA